MCSPPRASWSPRTSSSSSGTPGRRSPRISPRPTPTSAPPCRRSRTARGTPSGWGWRSSAASVDGTVVVVCGDTPLLTGATLHALAATHSADGNAVTVLTAEVPDATGYGRIVRDGVTGAVTAIVEHKDATESQRAIREINSGVFAFDGQLLADALGKVRTDNTQGEEYLTDVLGILREAGHRVGASVAGDHREIAGINNRVQLSEARRILNDRLLTGAMLAGVTVIDPATTWIDVDRHLRAGRGRAPGYAAARRHASRRGRRGRPQQPADGHPGGRGRPGRQHRRRQRRDRPAGAPSGRTPICGRVRGWVRRARSGRTSRRRTRRSARGRRSRICRTSGTRRSVSTRTSVPRACS